MLPPQPPQEPHPGEKDKKFVTLNAAKGERPVVGRTYRIKHKHRGVFDGEILEMVRGTCRVRITKGHTTGQTRREAGATIDVSESLCVFQEAQP